MVLATDLFHMMDDPGGPSHVNFDEPVATFDARYALAGAAAPIDAEYVVLALDPNLTNERVLIGTANQILIADGGAGGNVTLSTPQDIHTGATPTFAGGSFTGDVDFGDDDKITFGAVPDAELYWHSTRNAFFINPTLSTTSAKYVLQLDGTADSVLSSFVINNSRAVAQGVGAGMLWSIGAWNNYYAGLTLEVNNSRGLFYFQAKDSVSRKGIAALGYPENSDTVYMGPSTPYTVAGTKSILRMSCSTSVGHAAGSTQFVNERLASANGRLTIEIANAGTPTERFAFTHLGEMGINVSAPAAKLDIDQYNTSGAMPVLKLDQADVSEEFINFTIAGDQDMVLAKLSVTGNPTINWDESEDAFSLSHGLIVADVDGIDINPGGDVDADLITVGVTGIPRFWWNEATDSFEMNKSLTLPGPSLIVGSQVLSEDTTENDEGFDVVGTIHIAANPGGYSGNILLHEGTEPPIHASGDAHRIWVDANHDIMWQDHLGVSSIIHVHGGTDQFNAEAIAAVEGEATLQFQQPTVISTKSGAGTITLQSVGNSVIIQAGIDIRMKSSILLFDNKDFWVGTSKDYWFEYNTSGSRFRFWSRDIDGIGTDGVVFRILDGTQNVQFIGAVHVDTIDEFSAGVGVAIESVLLKDGLVDSRDIAVDGTKLDGIEPSATADQSDAEIKIAYENNADTNEFSDAEQTKLAGISEGSGVPTKEFFIPAGAGVLDSGATFDESNIALSESGTFARCFFSFRLPTDFSSLDAGYPKVVMKPGVGGGGNVRIFFEGKSGGVGEQSGARIDSIPEYTKAMSATSHVIIEEDISAAVDGLSLVAGSYVEVKIQRDSDDVLDTLNGDLDIMGVIVKYS